MAPRNLLLGSALFLLLSSVSLGLIGCEDDDGTGPNPDPTGSADIGPPGGVVQSQDGALTVTVPAGALATTQTITISSVDPATLSAAFDSLVVEAAYELEPDGLTFNAPVTLTFVSDQAAFPAAGRVMLVPEALFTLNTGGELEKLANAEMLANEADGSVFVTGETDHFTPVVSAVDRRIQSSASGLVAEFRFERNFAETQFALTTTITRDDATSWSSLPIQFVDETDAADATPAGNGSYFFQGSDFAGGNTAEHTLTYACAREGTFDLRARLSYGTSYSGNDLLRVLLRADCPGPDDPGPSEAFSVGTGLAPEFALTFSLDSKSWDDHPVEDFDMMLVAGAFGTKLFDLKLRAEAFDVAPAPVSPYYGALPLAAAGSTGDFTSGIFSFGAPGGFWKPYSASSGFDNFGLAFAFQSFIWDAQLDGGDPDLGRITYVYGRQEVRFVLFDGPSSINAVGSPIPRTSLDNSQGGEIIGALRTTFDFKRRAAGDVLIVTAGTGETGNIYLADSESPFAQLTSLGNVGNDPRRLRALNGVAAVSNFGSDDLTIFTFTETTVTVTEPSIAVGDGPVGIDIIELSNGNIAISSTGFNDDTYAITIVDASGNLVSSQSSSVPLDGQAPGHATWTRRGSEIWMVVSCNGSDEVILIPTEL